MAKKSPLDTAKPHQLIWDQVAPILESCRQLENPTYVYFIGEEDNGFLKIGHAKNPFTRLADMQVGNPRRLRIERLLVGDKATERLIHDLWFEFRLFANDKNKKIKGRPRTEWFRPEIRKELFPILDIARDGQLAILANPQHEDIYLSDLEDVVRDAHIERDHQAKLIQPVYRMSNYGVVPSRSSAI